MLTNLHPAVDYAQQRYDSIQREEGYEPNAYVDTEGIPTIGIGYNLRVWLEPVLRTFGFDVDGTRLFGAKAAAAEQDFMGSFHCLFLR